MARIDRKEFTERIRLQVQSRYADTSVTADPESFALRVTAPGIDSTLALAPLHNACERQPARTSALIADFVRVVEKQLTPRTGTELSLTRILWCTRNVKYLDDIGRRDDLMIREIAGDLVAFVAEVLPNGAMRGLPRDHWETAGFSGDAVRHAADTNTTARFAKLAARIGNADRIPADGWKLSGDVLFQGSVLLCDEILAAFRERAQSDVLIANPDRSLVLILPVNLPSARSFAMRATREWREAMNPASREVYLAAQDGLRVLPRKSAAVMPWLSE